MKILQIAVLICFTSCSNWKQSVYPKYGYSIGNDDVVLVRNIDLESQYDHQLTSKVLESYTGCESRFIDYQEVLDQLHANLLDLENYEYPDSTILARIQEATDANYYLTGGFYAESDRGVGIYGLSDWEKEYDPGSLARWRKYEFRLYDLGIGKQVFSVNLKWTRTHSDEGSTRVYLPSVGVYAKLIKKLRNSCGCE